ncbi:MAG: hypothetical protein LRZ90_04705 [Thermodesulfovibrionales bacterium]|nr:hypothetical protein [Thermodesulfovibrionales bacterium]
MRLVVADMEKCIGCQSCMSACARRQGEAGLANTCIGVKSVGGMARGFIAVVCIACDAPSCAKVCLTNALSPREKGGECVSVLLTVSGVVTVAMPVL